MRVVLLAHGATSAVRRASFAADEPLEEGALASAPALPRYEEVRCAPALRCRQTADGLSLPAAVDDDLAGLDHGKWTGRTLDEIAAEDPAGLTQWLTDPESVPHGGESTAAFVARIGSWLRAVPTRPRGLLAVVDPAVVRAALAHALGAPPTAFWRVDVDPLAVAVLVGESGRWTLRELRTGPGRGTGTPP
ncbi:histidine phosphatase family protein [Pseudonocardia ailaonensis]|uniref:Histidine phosphatase family protein n=1 Tax=Pseudonocardia ailaonensis TaxID=367279 RepID=A0ABN2N745_9PSEU